ncbi:MAG: SMC-Scp complex subunit ScpB [Clostridia bacterium]|nr:SMC-Scp complex subunit ScpB [Clostridia bacterium]
MNMEQTEQNIPAEEIPAAEEAPIDMRHSEEILEAILFAAGHPLTYAKIGSVLGVTDETAKKIAEDYAAVYNRTDGDIPRGVMLLLFPDSCQLCTREEFGQYVREALGIRRGGNLSQSSIETLAIIAYNEPVTRAYIETVRGVDSSYAVTSLCEKNLIEVCGRLDVPGRPLLYRTTPDFLRVFGLSSISELPEVSAMSFAEENEDALLMDEVPSAEADDDAPETEA